MKKVMKKALLLTITIGFLPNSYAAKLTRKALSGYFNGRFITGPKNMKKPFSPFGGNIVAVPYKQSHGHQEEFSATVNFAGVGGGAAMEFTRSYDVETLIYTKGRYGFIFADGRLDTNRDLAVRCTLEGTATSKAKNSLSFTIFGAGASSSRYSSASVSRRQISHKFYLPSRNSAGEPITVRDVQDWCTRVFAPRHKVALDRDLKIAASGLTITNPNSNCTYNEDCERWYRDLLVKSRQKFSLVRSDINRFGYYCKPIRTRRYVVNKCTLSFNGIPAPYDLQKEIKRLQRKVAKNRWTD